MTRPLHVLLVDDDEVDRRTIRTLLRNAEAQVEVVEAVDVPAGIANLRRTQFDCALIDHRLPGGDAFTMLSMASESAWGSVPMVVLTGVGDEDLGLRLVQAGAQDYLSKDALEPARLMQAIRYAMERKRSELESRKQFGHLHEMEKLEAVASLSRGIAHQFNNLLMVIIGLGELVRDELPENSPLRPDLDEILEAGHRGSTLTQQLLAFARTDMAHPEVLDLNTVIGSTRDLVGETVGRSINIKHQLAEGLLPLKMDPGHVERVLLNLCLNAAEAMPSGGTVTVTTRNLDLTESSPANKKPKLEPGRYVQLIVADDGIGMAPEILGRAFEPFFTTKGPGFGLGLSTVYGLVRQAGGDVRIDSGESEGTTVRILLPAWEEKSSPSSRPIGQVSRRSAIRRVLLAEDEVSVRKLARRLLERSGFQVIEVEDGPAALRAVERVGLDSIDLLLTDSVMPLMTGSELAAELLGQRPDLPVVVMSGYTETPTVSDLARTANLAFLRKPFSSERLAETIDSLLGPADHAD